MDARQRIAELEAADAAKGARIAELEATVAAKDAEIAVLKEQVATLMATVATLTKQVAALTEKFGQNSRNSHLPPSSDPPGSAGQAGHGGKPKNGRKRGGQGGHRGSRRQMVPEAQVDEFVDLFPAECENCWAALPERLDPDAKRYQYIEVPPIQPHTTEVRRHAVTCSCCGYRTRATYDEQLIPASPFGPRLMGIVALLTGVYHVSRRSTAKLLSDLVGVPISLGAVSAVEARVADAVKPAVDEAWARVEGAEVKHTDGTTWLKAGALLALWTIATTAATVFKIDDTDWRRALDLAKTTREKTELWRLVGMRFDGIAAIHEIVKLDPRSDLLAVLVVRELTRAESNNGGVYSVADIGSDQELKRRDAEAALENIVAALAATPGVDRKWLLDLVAGHLAALRGDVQAARARTGAAVAARPGDAAVVAQAKASVALALAQSWRFDARHEADLGRAMMLGSDFDRAGAVDDYVRRALAPAYAKAGRFVDAEYLVPGSVDQETEYSRFEGRPGPLHWAKTSFILDMIMRFDRRATDFDRFVLAHPPFTKPQLEQELGLRYLLDGDFAAARQTFLTTDALSQRLHTDPFVIHIRDCHDCDHDKYANAAWTHGSFVAKMAELAKTAQGTGDAAAQAALQLGIGYYNMTWYGNARSILGDDTHQDTHQTKAALKWFARAFELANDRELKAKAAYDAAKAEAGDRLDVADDPNRQGSPAWTPVTWFAKLQTLKDTRYYKEVLGECGVFADWASAGP